MQLMHKNTAQSLAFKMRKQANFPVSQYFPYLPEREWIAGPSKSTLRQRERQDAGFTDKLASTTFCGTSCTHLWFRNMDNGKVASLSNHSVLQSVLQKQMII